MKWPVRQVKLSLGKEARSERVGYGRRRAPLVSSPRPPCALSDVWIRNDLQATSCYQRRHRSSVGLFRLVIPHLFCIAPILLRLFSEWLQSLAGRPASLSRACGLYIYKPMVRRNEIARPRSPPAGLHLSLCRAPVL